MSDSDKTNELDNYGVWVKKPPRTVSSENGEDNTDTISDIDNDLPDFAAIDVVDDPMVGADPNADDTTLSADELANITGSFEGAAPAPEAGSSGETEEISLDEFIEGGVFEGDDDAAPASSEPAASTAPQAEESVSADEFMESSDITVSDAPQVSESSALSDDGPIDIDLSFDDSDSSASASSASSSSAAPVKEVAGSEEVDLSDFGVDFGDGDSSSSSESSGPSSDGTESVDLSDFGVDFSDGPSSEPSAPAAEPASEPVINDDGTEEVSLDSFGFDINAEEPGAEGSAPAQATETAEEEVSPSLSDENPSLEESSSPSIELSAEDDVGDISIEAEPSAPAQESAPAQTFESQDNDDFNLDSIMDSIEDENGNKTSLNDNSGFVADEAIAEEEPVAAEEPVSAEQETIIEEPVVNDVVDMDEPVFEETAVDIPEETTTEPAADSDSDNPFALPPDDAFTATVTDEPTIHDEPDENIALSDEAPLSGEPVFEEPVAIDEPVEEPVPEESITEEPVSFEDPGISEDLEQEPVIEESAIISEPVESTPVAEEPAEPVKKDAEISSAANDILNQIASELSSLRNEISNLKSEFEELKNKEAAPAAAEPEEAEIPAESESSGGFFGSEDEDDTIALSLDEMDNILNTVEMVEETAPTIPESANSVTSEPEVEEPVVEEPVIDETLPEETVAEEPALSEEPVESEPAEESLDFSNENIEEPVLDDIDTNIADEELPDEILVPKSEDDILVGSSQENLIEETDAAESTEDLSIDEPVDEAHSIEEDINFEVEQTVSTESEDSTMVDEPFVFDDTEDEADATLSADELANIAADSSMMEEAGEEITDEETVAEESVEESEEPAAGNIPDVSDILGDTSSDEEEESSGISISEGELDNLLSSEAALAEQNRKLAEEEEKAEPVHSSIPGDLQKEIKSVLSYMDQLLENLPEEKIAEFAQSEQFETYKKLFKELGLD